MKYEVLILQETGLVDQTDISGGENARKNVFREKGKENKDLNLNNKYSENLL